MLGMAAVSGSAQAADEEAALKIAQASNCMACHSVDAKLVGPAWREVGKKYADDTEAKAKLTAKVKDGGKGVWGEIPMPPNPTVSDADLGTMVDFILTLK
ncbi:c-type cytochrome (plasmid) [Thiothrix subterranea]|nr:c-type cytochrome [Thiothrix subterranea]WML84937.1 c-type cytochrome [Thiothrix subterranea]